MTRLEEIEIIVKYHLPNFQETTPYPLKIEAINYLIARVKKLTLALEFYATHGQKSEEEYKIGDINEFGCGCCAGKYIDASIAFPHVDYELGRKDKKYDREIQGETARKALEDSNSD